MKLVLLALCVAAASAALRGQAPEDRPPTITDTNRNPGSSPDTDSAYRAALSLAHERGAERLLQLCLNNGGLYLKAGQHLATLRYALPDQYTSALSAQLFDSAVTMPFSTVCQTICDELGVKDVHDVFVSVDSEPLAAASLAQVRLLSVCSPSTSSCLFALN